MLKKSCIKILLVAFIFSLVVFLPVYCESGNIVKNGDFESGFSGWTLPDMPDGVKVENDKSNAQSGSGSAKIVNGAPSDTLVTQDLKVEPGKIYKLSCSIKTENIKNTSGAANITLYYVSNGHGCKGIITSRELSDTGNKWQKMEFNFNTLEDVNDPLTLALRLGGQGTVNEGTAYFDDLKVELVEKADSSIENYNFYVPEQSSDSGASSPSTASGNKGASSLKTPLFIILGVLGIGLLIFAEMKLSKRNKNNNDGNAEENAEEDDDLLDDDINSEDGDNEDNLDAGQDEEIDESDEFDFSDDYEKEDETSEKK